MRLVEQRQVYVGQVDELQFEARVLLGLADEPLRNRGPLPLFSRADDDDLQMHQETELQARSPEPEFTAS